MSSAVANFITDEILLPSQFYSTAADTPQKRLMLAVLEKAVEDLTDQRLTSWPGAKARLRRETAAWFASSDASWPYSFVNICQELHLDADKIRHAVLVPRLEAA